MMSLNIWKKSKSKLKSNFYDQELASSHETLCKYSKKMILHKLEIYT